MAKVFHWTLDDHYSYKEPRYEVRFYTDNPTAVLHKLMDWGEATPFSIDNYRAYKVGETKQGDKE